MNKMKKQSVRAWAVINSKGLITCNAFDYDLFQYKRDAEDSAYEGDSVIRVEIREVPPPLDKGEI